MAKGKTKKALKIKAQELYIEIKRIFPYCGVKKARHLANYGVTNTHSLRYSNSSLQDKAIKTVFSYVRHNMTDYDTISKVKDRQTARQEVQPKIMEIVSLWGFKNEY